jgi:riboflavin kinase/FMN adenylyltransferase
MSTVTIDEITLLPPDFQGGAISIGNFDGVHRGHRELVIATVHEARIVGGPAIAVTFEPPPQAVLHPASAQPPLTTPSDRAERLLAVGADRVVTLRTDRRLLDLTAEAFFERVILGQFQAKAVVEGFNFRFGKGRAGDTARLRELCHTHHLRFTEVPPRKDGSQVISSSRIRHALTSGDVTTAAELLGWRYSVRGVVETGAKRGRTIGFPTANLGRIPTLLPKDGVYAVTATVGGQTFAGAANIGPNPTFGDTVRKVEVHLIDFHGDLYGTELRIEFVQRLRDTRSFSGVGELVEQLMKDIAAARTAREPGTD